MIEVEAEVIPLLFLLKPSPFNLSRAGSALITIESSVEELEVPDLRRSSLTSAMSDRKRGRD